MNEEYLKNMCTWLKDHKNITKIDLIELIEFVPEYEKWINEEKKEWCAENIKCDLCGYEFVSVHNVESDRLECSNCNNMTIY